MRGKIVNLKKKGFTLIEVIVALAILMVGTLALLVSYAGYYQNVQYQRYKTIGENLAQLQLEDIQSLPNSILKNLVRGGSFLPNYPVDKDTSNIRYDSGKIDGKFKVSRITSIDGLANELPTGIGLDTYTEDTTTLYDVTLYDKIYPGYMKQIIIEDLTPSNSSDWSKQIYKISIIVYWTLNGVERNVLVQEYKTDTGYSK